MLLDEMLLDEMLRLQIHIFASSMYEYMVGAGYVPVHSLTIAGYVPVHSLTIAGYVPVHSLTIAGYVPVHSLTIASSVGHVDEFSKHVPFTSTAEPK